MQKLGDPAVRHYRELIAWQLAVQFKREVIRLLKTSRDYGLGSLGEAENRLQDGIDWGYFLAADCESAFRLARRCLTASVRLKQSQQRHMKDKKNKKKR